LFGVFSRYGEDEFASIGKELFVELQACDYREVGREKVENLDVEMKTIDSNGDGDQQEQPKPATWMVQRLHG
jgi:hypothetical protein